MSQEPEAGGGDPPISTHAVAVIGAATAGAEVASRLAERGVLVTVFEQNARPFGKIEDGLPRWHAKLREKEYERITAKLSTPGIDYVPRTTLGDDVQFDALLAPRSEGGWGYTALVLANGAWRDRPLEVKHGPDPELLVGHGFEYQNPFVISFNHAFDERFEGPRITIPKGGGVVIGGGLAAIDVAKILNLEAVHVALRERGIEVSTDELEHAGIPESLDALGLTWHDLDLHAATVCYRRRVADMAVVTMPDGADQTRRAQIEATREKFIAKVRAKFLVEIEPLVAPEALVVADGQVTGLLLRRTVMADGRLVRTDEKFELPANIVVSSIGSIPRPIRGIPMRGELYDFDPNRPGNLTDRDDVFAVGNVLTGKGNITVSRRHAIEISDSAIEAYLGISDTPGAGPDADPHAGPAAVSQAAGRVADELLRRTATIDALAPEALADIRARVRARQRTVGYSGDLAAWIAASGGPC